MKPMYRCEYCDHMGTEDEVREHEAKCIYNYDRNSCWTCKHRDKNSLMRFKCLCGVEIPEGKLLEFCGKYEWDEETHTHNTDNIFRGLFGGL